MLKKPGDATFAPGEGKAYVNIDYSNYASVDPSSLTLTANGFDADVVLLSIKYSRKHGIARKGTAEITA